MKTLIYDLEIVRCIPSSSTRFDEYEYCDGWRDFENMGISVCAYGWLWDEAITVFKWNDKEPRALFAEALKEADIISGFNSSAFDDHLLAANGIQARTNYDILAEARLAAYGSTEWQKQPDGASYKLDAIAQANGQKKIGSGSLAPQWWQEGLEQKVLDYCFHDVAVERKMLRMLLACILRDPNTGKMLKGRDLADYSYH